jgi:uncharacterized lipoprotein YajG
MHKIIAGLALSVALVAGCGTDSSTESTEPAAPKQTSAPAPQGHRAQPAR